MGIRILRRNLRLFRDARPALAFLLLAVPWLLVAALLLIGPVVDYVNTRLVARFPSLIVGVGFLVVAIFIVFSGVIMQRSALIVSRLRACSISPTVLAISERPCPSCPAALFLASRTRVSSQASANYGGLCIAWPTAARGGFLFPQNERCKRVAFEIVGMALHVLMAGPRPLLGVDR